MFIKGGEDALHSLACRLGMDPGFTWTEDDVYQHVLCLEARARVEAQMCRECGSHWATSEACVNPKCDNFLKDYALRRFQRYFRGRVVAVVEGETPSEIDLPKPWKYEQTPTSIVCYAPRPDGVHQCITINF